MENYENQDFNYYNTDTPFVQPVAPESENRESAPYRGAGAGRRESPFADSPYVMNRPVEPRRPKYYNTWENAPRPEKPKKKKGGFLRTAVAAVLVVALVVTGCLVTASVVNDRWEDRLESLEREFDAKLEALQQDKTETITTNQNRPSVIVRPATSGELMTPSQVYAQNVNAVVMVNTSVKTGNQIAGISTGSGFIISEDGYVLTNYHVVEGGDVVSIATPGGDEYDARIIGTDSTNDVALLKVEATGLPFVSLGNSEDLIVGDQVVAIGNPLGELTSTMTVGYVSGKERDVTTDGTTINMIQTDAAINSGNSGGPLFNMMGEVVGITTAKYSGNSSSGASIEGIGFAIPINDVLDVAEDLMEFGYVKSAYMGVVVREMNADTAALYNLPVGAYVDSVEQNGPADKAGIQPEDIIIGLDDTEITGLTTLTRALRGYEPGDVATVTVFRAGQRVELEITLVERPRDTDTQVQPEGQTPDNEDKEWYDYTFPFFGGND